MLVLYVNSKICIVTAKSNDKKTRVKYFFYFMFSYPNTMNLNMLQYDLNKKSMISFAHKSLHALIFDNIF